MEAGTGFRRDPGRGENRHTQRIYYASVRREVWIGGRAAEGTRLESV